MFRFFSFRAMPFYAVRVGRKTGIFETWSECEQQVKGFRKATYKKFNSKSEAENFLAIKNNNINNCKRIYESNIEELKEQNEIDQLLRAALKNEGMLPAKKKFRANHDKNEIKNTILKNYGGHYFHEDEEGYVQVFTDGSCENNGKPGAIAGIGVYFGEDHALNISEPVEGRATNNIGEIKASIKAISEAKKSGILRLNILTDSKFLINSVSKWMSKWKENNWTLSSGKSVANKNDFKVLDDLINTPNMLIKWTYVPAHCGHYGNERADHLAKEGARKSKL